MRKFVCLRWVIVVLCFCFECNSTSDVCLYLLKAGQANFSITVVGNRAVVVDCGCNKKADWCDREVFKTAKTQILSNILKNVTHVTTIITHDHHDHKNLLIPLQNLCTTIHATCRVLNGWEVEDLATWPVNVLDGILGANTIVSYIKPAVFPGVGAHDRNLIIKILSQNGTIILPGDAPGRIIEQSATHMPGCFSDIDVFVLPHHGSTENKEYRLYQMLFEGGNPPCLSIISSDSDGADRIPGSTITALDFSPISTIGAAPRTPMHSWSATHTVKACCATPPAPSKQVSVGKKPVFITSNAVAPYYKVKLAPDGFITLHDGEADTPQFFGFRSTATVEIIARRLASESRRYFPVATATPYCEGLIRQLKLIKLPGNVQQQVRTRAEIINFIENDITTDYAWSTFALSQGLLGNEHRAVDDFLMIKLYETWQTPLYASTPHYQMHIENKKNKLIDYIKHYSPQNEYIPDQTFFYRKNDRILGWLRGLTGGEKAFFESFLIARDLLK